MGVEEEGKLRAEFVELEAAPQCVFDIFHAIAKGEGQFLDGGGAGFADVIAADGDGVELGSVLLTPNSKVSMTRRMEGSGG